MQAHDFPDLIRLKPEDMVYNPVNTFYHKVIDLRVYSQDKGLKIYTFLTLQLNLNANIGKVKSFLC